MRSIACGVVTCVAMSVGMAGFARAADKYSYLIDFGAPGHTEYAGKDFGDFVVWRSDGVPAYQLACVTDDAAMGITEVVRGADLLVSTARQILLYRALNLPVPGFFHCELMLDDAGQRLAKRHDSLSLRTLRGQGISPAEIRAGWRSPG